MRTLGAQRAECESIAIFSRSKPSLCRGIDPTHKLRPSSVVLCGLIIFLAPPFTMANMKNLEDAESYYSFPCSSFNKHGKR
jgi:hypothetical protein